MNVNQLPSNAIYWQRSSTQAAPQEQKPQQATLKDYFGEKDNLNKFKKDYVARNFFVDLITMAGVGAATTLIAGKKIGQEFENYLKPLQREIKKNTVKVLRFARSPKTVKNVAQMIKKEASFLPKLAWKAIPSWGKILLAADGLLTAYSLNKMDKNLENKYKSQVS